MEAELKTGKRWPLVVGYPLFFLTCFVFFFHLTLPYSMLQGRLVETMRQLGYTLSVVSLGPTLGFGIAAKGFSLSPIQAVPTASGAPPEPTVIEQLAIRPTLFPPGIRVAARAFGGDVQVHLTGYSSGPKGDTPGFTKLEGLSIKNLDLSKAHLKGALGVVLAGTVNVDADINHFDEMSKATGTFKVSGKDLQLVSGTVSMFDLPKLALGNVDLQVKMDSGKATLDKFTVGGGDVEANGEGEITLNNHLGASQSKLHIDFKPGEEWLTKNSFIKMGLSQAGKADSRGFYTVTMTGMLGNPKPALKQ